MEALFWMYIFSEFGLFTLNSHPIHFGGVSETFLKRWNVSTLQ